MTSASTINYICCIVTNLNFHKSESELARVFELDKINNGIHFVAE